MEKSCVTSADRPFSKGAGLRSFSREVGVRARRKASVIVGVFVAVKASKEPQSQQLSTSRSQQVQYQSLRDQEVYPEALAEVL
jgi:hypothetical protein